jgi:hypothetical protein
MRLTHALIAPGERRLARQDTMYATAAEAWAAAARLVVTEPQGDDTAEQRLATAAAMLDWAEDGTTGEYEVIRYAVTDVSVVSGSGGDAEQAVLNRTRQNGLGLACYGGELAGTWQTMLALALGDLLSDADSIGVQVRALLRRADLPEGLGEPPTSDAQAGRSVWLQGVAHMLDAEQRVVFADGVTVDLAAATFVHLTY